MKILKRFLLTCCIALLLSSVHSQEPAPAPDCLLSNGLCNYNLSDTSTSLPFNTTGQNLNISYGKYNASPNYPGDVTYKDENDGKCTNTGFSGDVFCTTGDNGVLHYDVYYPVVAYPSACPLPAVIYVHGGGFSDCNVLGTGGADPNGIAFAKRGFIL